VRIVNDVLTDVTLSAIPGATDDEAYLIVELVTTNTDTLTITNEAWASVSPAEAGTQTSTEHAVTWEMELEEKPGRLYWSKAGLPAAVPYALNFTDVGDVEIPIRRILPARDALWICKDDGIWRLTGDGADAGWRVDEVSSAKIVSARAGARLGDAAIAWTNRGIVVMAQTLADADPEMPIRGDLSAYADTILSGTPSTGTFLRTSDRLNEIYVGVPATAAATESAKVYVLNTDTSAWTTWELALRDVVDALVGSDGQRLWISRPGTGYESVGLAMERVSGVRCADLSYSVTLTAGAGGYDYTDSVGDWTPKVGDLVARATEPAASYAFVTATDGTNFDLSAALSNGAGTAYDSYESVIEWVAKTARDPLTTKFWRSIGLWWESLFGATSAYQYSVGFKTENRPTTDTADVQVVSLVRNPDTTQFAATRNQG
jgi:hypothetical protein